MAHWEIKHVEQVGKTCTIGCLAMILGRSFSDVEKLFRWPENGTLAKMANFLGDYGYSVLIKELMFHAHPNFGRHIISKPFAPAHIIHCKQFADDEVQHVVVMDQFGTIFDPARKPGETLFPLNDYYMLTGVLGIWRPEDVN